MSAARGAISVRSEAACCPRNCRNARPDITRARHPRIIDRISPSSIRAIWSPR